MKGTEYVVSLKTGVAVTKECNVMANNEEFNWYHGISDVTDGMSYKPMSL